MARLLAIDYGLKRIGLAVTDPEQRIATPLDVISPAALIPYLSRYVSENPVEAFVLGFPVRLDNSDTHITGKVRKLAEDLKNKFSDIRVYLHDERFTSAMALDSMLTGGVKKKDRRNKKLIDKVSATIILQSFLEQRSMRKD